ncbi:hypothetical protein CAPTEDRAFT_178637 [Capitella teleta]|uniref:Longin domain-containing protein n=1 Tax=Capitella teleta TaxID=283909 RepID=R7V8F2_CAPTE|nr:hypothetical protein CAPTEDRAFT_178637 [Capitella teleta]|eukprot:ELU14829.1 hypothetical protein CAPTEDRAFT_178637 [Capitella teleta]
MVVQAVIYRTLDGLALTATTDVGHSAEINSCQRYIKLVARRLSRLPDRCTLQLQGFNIHVTSTISLAFLVLCEDSYPSVLAFSFLDEIMKEFLINYDASQVQRARRPYAFIEFDTFLQKTKQRYNKTRSLATRVNLAEMTLEMKLRPPYLIKDSDLDTSIVANGDTFLNEDKTTYRPTAVPGRRLVPTNWVDMIAVILCATCSMLNITRGMSIINHGHFDEDDAYAYRYGATFLFSAFISSVQIYRMFYFGHWRLLKTSLLFLLQCVCIYLLSDFRNFIQIVFHISVSLFASVMTLGRRLTEKLPGYSV